MTGLLTSIIRRFLETTRIYGHFASFPRDTTVIILFIFGLAMLFAGFFMYRLVFSISLFMAITFLSVFLLEGRVNWGVVTVCFSVIGILLSVLGYAWNRFGGFSVCFLIGAAFSSLIFQNIWIILLGGVLFGVFEIFFPIIAICLSTALFGTFLVVESPVISLLRANLSFFRFLGMVLLFLIGGTLQLFLSRKQTLFAKVCPDRVSYWIRQKRNRGRD